jgi:membrane-bound serine protease (ClpP class)
MTVDGTIGPTTASYVARAIQESADMQAQCLIMYLDTPSGLLDATQDIVQEILTSPVPVVVYVAPRGASAGSAAPRPAPPSDTFRPPVVSTSAK